MLTTPLKSVNQSSPKSLSSSNLKIIADEKILHVKKAFSTIGDVTVKKGSEITPSDVAQADVLLTRTTTRVTEKLLKNSTIQFVATATAGTDHIDLDYLSRKSIGFTSAPGCNSVAVGEFVINALVRLAITASYDLTGKTLGIIGAGNAGSALKRKAICLGLQCLLNDPPLYEQTGNSNLIPIEELIKKSDIVSLHVPLTKTGPHPTYHLIDQKILKAMKPQSILINTSRGGVVDEKDLANTRDKFRAVILDVWENEPDINVNSLPLADIATPHIAGYSLDGKFKATEIIYKETCTYFGKTPTWKSPRQRKAELLKIDLADLPYTLDDILKQSYDVFEDDKMLRALSVKPEPVAYFQALRGNYEFRQEFSNFEIINSSQLPKKVVATLKRLGFTI